MLRRFRSETGAAAVEFALLVPIFVMITFGSISGGILFWHNIEITQAARDAARFGATLPISTQSPQPSGTVSIDDWLTEVASVAVAEGGWGSPSDVGNVDDGYVCVAYVPGSGGSSLLNPQNLAYGNPRPSDPDPAVSSDRAQPCYDDGLTGNANSDVPRAQVVIRRDGRIEAVLYNPSFNLTSTSTLLYERTPP